MSPEESLGRAGNPPAVGDASPPGGEKAGRPEADVPARQRDRPANMLPGRERRRFPLERLLVRLVATGGVIGVGVALGAILTASKTQGWIIGLVVAIVSVVLSAILWSSRQL